MICDICGGNRGHCECDEPQYERYNQKINFGAGWCTLHRRRKIQTKRQRMEAEKL
jgi:hypothetical protein